MLQEPIFIYEILYNSEVWHGVNKGHIEKLSKVDHQLLRSVLSPHAKIPTEFLYLKTGVLPVKHVISIRRLKYLLEIHNREDHKLMKRIHTKQKQNPVRGDWTELVMKDLELLELTEDTIEIMDKTSAKKLKKSELK